MKERALARTFRELAGGASQRADRGVSLWSSAVKEEYLPSWRRVLRVTAARVQDVGL